MKFWIRYLRTWLIIKKKHLGKKLSTSKTHNYTKFVILCAPRSGSNWLHTLLNSHPYIFSYGEILRRTFESNPSKSLASIQKLVFSPHQKRIKAVGLKLFYQYLNDINYSKSFQEVVDDTSILIVHLIRKKTLAQYTSLKKAEVNQLWSHSQSQKNIAPIRLDFEKFLLFQKNQINLKRDIMNSFLNHRMIEICYEDLLLEPEKNLFELQRFLQVKPRGLFSLLQRQSNGYLKHEILNWKEFEEFI